MGAERPVVKGDVGKQDQSRRIKGKGDKVDFISYPLAVSQGTGDNARTTWYQVNANVGEGKVLPESMAEAVTQGTPLAIIGVTRPDAYIGKGESGDDEARASQILYARMVQFGIRVDGDGSDSDSDDEPNFD